VESIGFTRDPYKDRDLSRVFFQVFESKYDQSDYDLGIPLRIYTGHETSLDFPAFNLDLSAILDVNNSEMSGFFIYVEQLFDRDTVSKFVDVFVRTLRQFAELGSSTECQLKFVSTKTSNVSGIPNVFSKSQIQTASPIRSCVCVPPRTDTEKAICQIWTETLGINANKFGVNTDFFQIGGNGLLGLNVLAIMKNVLGIKLSLRQLYQFKTVGRVVDYLNQRNHSNCANAIFKLTIAKHLN